MRINIFKEIVKRTATKKLGDTNKELAKCREEVPNIDKKLVDTLDALLEGKIDLEEKNRYTDAKKQAEHILRYIDDSDIRDNYNEILNNISNIIDVGKILNQAAFQNIAEISNLISEAISNLTQKKHLPSKRKRIRIDKKRPKALIIPLW